MSGGSRPTGHHEPTLRSDGRSIAPPRPLQRRPGLLDRLQRALRAFRERGDAPGEREAQLLDLRRQVATLQGQVAGLEEARGVSEQALRAKERFLAVMSHELRTPLHGVVGTAQLLDTADAREHRRLRAMLRQSAEDLSERVQSILDYAELDEERGTVHERTRLDELLQEAERVFQPAAARKDLWFRQGHPASLPTRLVMDAIALRRALWTLLDNAVKFTATGGLTLTVTFVDDRLRVEVSDTGRGMTSEEQALAFQVFTQGDQSGTREVGGMGLGLSLAQRYVELAHGEMGVESSPGWGSVFWFELPAERSDSLTAPMRLGPAPTRILVAEDNPVNRVVAKGLLQKLGYQLDTAVNGEDAVRQVVDGQYGLVLMDCEMPVMDGLTATRTLRDLGVDVPIIAATAYTDQSNRQRCHAAGMNGFLAKPLHLEVLAAELERWMPLVLL